jgi:hypothetical protein
MNDVAIQLRTFGGDLTAAALLIRTATPRHNLDEADDLDDLAEEAMDLARSFAGKQEPVEGSVAETLLQLGERAQMSIAAIREPNISEAGRNLSTTLRQLRSIN